MQGQFGQQKIYDVDPLKMAERYEQEGARYLHIVDLDGAKEGHPKNADVILRIRQKVSMFIEVGGGIRDIQTAAMYLDAGIDRIIIGTQTVEDEQFLSSLIKTYGERIAIGLDVKRDEVMVRGWLTKTSLKLSDILIKLESLGVKTLICTDIEKDGMLKGTNLELYQRLKSKTTMNVIASGGITTIQDIIELKKIGVDGAIIGKALYEQRISLKEVLAC
jgi:phosphoribosylformimino-5-aminoimidazole carboxamide ribotide isomerase